MARILIAEDDELQAEVRRILLESEGHEVRIAHTAAEAVALDWEPQVLLADLRLPTEPDGMALIGYFRQAMPRVKIIVLSGLEGETPLADVRLRKPAKPGILLETIAKLAMCLALAIAPLTGQSIAFELDRAGEATAELEFSSPSSDWTTPGREGALAEIRVDAGTPFHVMLHQTARHKYPVFLGFLKAGPHTLNITRRPEHSAVGSEVMFHAIAARAVPPTDPATFAPVMYARKNTIGKFSDIPIFCYYERGFENGQPILEYTVIFSNEDGGTSTRGLMARWGRTTDIEYVYRVYLKQDGGFDRAIVQGRGHKDVLYDGPKEGQHPLLIPVTDNNMVAGEGPSPVRYQLLPEPADLRNASREQTMDDRPWSYRVAAAELMREGKLRDPGAVDGEKIGDPRHYIYIEATVENVNARVAPMVRLRNDQRWRMGNLGKHELAIERSGWIRTTIELPPATAASQIAEIGFQCLGEKLQPGACTVRTVTKIFQLGPGFLPLPSFASLLNVNQTIPAGEAYTWTLGSK